MPNHAGALQGRFFPAKLETEGDDAIFNTLLGELFWIMHPELVAALEQTGWISSNSKLSAEHDIAEQERELEVATETEREALIAARLGQGQFRRDLLKIWGGCAVTGVTEPAVLKASHIKPWRNSTNSERLDPQNGLLLTSNLDSLFDAGLISFDFSGTCLLSPLLAAEDAHVLNVSNSTKLRRLPFGSEQFLSFHQKHVFRS